MWLGAELLVHVYASVGPDLASAFCTWCSPWWPLNQKLSSVVGTAKLSAFQHHQEHKRKGASHLYKNKNTEYVQNVICASFDMQFIHHLHTCLVCGIKGLPEEGLIANS